MRTVHGIEPKDPYKVWDFKTLGKKDDAVVRARKQHSLRVCVPLLCVKVCKGHGTALQYLLCLWCCSSRRGPLLRPAP